MNFRENTKRSFSLSKEEDVLYLTPEREIPAEDPVKVEAVEPTLAKSLKSLANLIANVTEAYTAAIFVRDPESGQLQVGGYHTLSRDFLPDAVVPSGSGLIGWTAENGVRISVSPFEHDATTLRYYAKDQALKSFVAVPILDENSQVMGVISCDSKKSYAFAKITEKLLFECAAQVQLVLKLIDRAESKKQTPTAPTSELYEFLNALRSCQDEGELFSRVAKIPQDLIERDALVVLATAEEGVGRGVFYSASPQSKVEHRLLELVCQRKKILCSDRVVHARSGNDIKQRSFLSVPFHVLGKEAGSFNLLSRPHQAFDAAQIASLEKTAEAVGSEIERIRLRVKFASSIETNGVRSWKHFAILANQALADAKEKKRELALIRFSLNNLSEIENLAGIDVAIGVMQKVMRLVEQVKRQSSIACYLYGFQILILSDASEAERIAARIRTLIKTVSLSDFTAAKTTPGLLLGDILLQGCDIATAQFPKDGSTLSELSAQTVRELEDRNRAHHMEVPINV